MKIGIDVYIFYFNSMIGFIDIVNRILEICMIVFLWMNRFNVDKKLLYLNIGFLVVAVFVNFYLSFLPGIIMLYYLHSILLMVYNMFFYFLVLSFLINYSRDA